MNTETQFPEWVEAIRRRGYVEWADERLSNEFRAQFPAHQIHVVGVRHVRQWGIQVDDEKTLPGHERSSMPDAELWEIRLEAADGSTFEVNSDLLVPSPT